MNNIVILDGYHDAKVSNAAPLYIPQEIQIYDAAIEK